VNGYVLNGSADAGGEPAIQGGTGTTAATPIPVAAVTAA